jgi:hypothetical protein
LLDPLGSQGNRIMQHQQGQLVGGKWATHGNFWLVVSTIDFRFLFQENLTETKIPAFAKFFADIESEVAIQEK